jgi:hypothetical protein
MAVAMNDSMKLEACERSKHRERPKRNSLTHFERVRFRANTEIGKGSL